MTLIEVVASLALLATLLVSIVLGYGQHAHQIKRAQRIVRATVLADQLLAQWLEEPDSFPIEGTGRIAKESLLWRTRQRKTNASLASICRVVEFELIDPKEFERLVHLEVALPALPSADSAPPTQHALNTR